MPDRASSLRCGSNNEQPGSTRLLRNCTTTALIISSALAAGCRTDEATHAYLAVAFVDGELLTRSIIVPPPEDGEYRLYYALESKDKICVLRGQIPDEGLFFLNPLCESRTGTGMLSCNNGESLSLQWAMTSCQGGNGRSIESAGSRFHFGFETTEDGALAQLRKAQTEAKEPEKKTKPRPSYRLLLQPQSSAAAPDH